MTPEGKVKEKIKTLLRRYEADGLWYCMPAANGYGVSGIPDFLICFFGQLIAIEAKASKGMPTALQKMQMGRLEDAGAIVFVVRDDRNLEDVEVTLNLILTKELHETAADK